MAYDIKNLSLEEKIGQMLMVGFEGNRITQRNIDQIQKYKVLPSLFIFILSPSFALNILQ